MFAFTVYVRANFHNFTTRLAIVLGGTVCVVSFHFWMPTLTSPFLSSDTSGKTLPGRVREHGKVVWASRNRS